MIRAAPCELPRSCPSANCSIRTTGSPRRARWYAAAEPIAPAPMITCFGFDVFHALRITEFTRAPSGSV